MSYQDTVQRARDFFHNAVVKAFDTKAWGTESQALALRTLEKGDPDDG